MSIRREPLTETALANRDARDAILDRASAGDASAIPEVRELLTNDPGAVDRFGGDMANQIQLTMIGALVGRNLLFKETLTRKMASLKKELAGPNPTPLERLLVDAVVTSWLHLHRQELLYAHQEDKSPKLEEHYQRRISAAQRRYLRAIGTLATVRKLIVPVQINIGQNQVNVAGGQSQ